MNNTEYEFEQRAEIERRVEYFEKNVDMDSKHFGRGNWIAAFIIAAASLTLLIWGYFA